MARIIHSRIKLFVEILFLVNKLLHYVEDKNTFKNFHSRNYNYYSQNCDTISTFVIIYICKVNYIVMTT